MLKVHTYETNREKCPVKPLDDHSNTENAVLHPPTPKKVKPSKASVMQSKVKGMSTMELLGHGLATPLHRKQGWLKALLIAEGEQLNLLI